MKKTMIKKALLSLSIAFAVSAAVGVNALTANAEEAINPAFASLALQNGASIRYAKEGEEATQEGFSYVLEMDAQAYAEVAANEAFTNVQYGILIGPEAYYDAYPFNNQANIDAYYSLNEEAEGKAFLYDMKAVEFTEGADESKVYYRGSIVELKENNLVRDYRGVGYVAYTFEGQDYKFFFTDETNVRCPVEIADLTIDTLNTEADADTIAALQANYINKIDWEFEPTTHGDGRWMQHWGQYVFGATGTSPAPVIPWNTANRYINSKYETVYTFERGEEVVAYTDGEAVSNLEGLWTVKGVTTCEFLAEPVVSYARNITFQKLGGPSSNFPTVNGNTITANAAGVLWNEAQGMYEQVDAWEVKAGYHKKATGNFIVDFELKGSINDEFRIWTSADTWIAFVSKDGGNAAGADGIYIYTDGGNVAGATTSWWTETRIKGNANVFTNPNERGVGALKMRIVNYSNMLFLCSNTYWNGTEVATADKYTVFAVLPGTGANPSGQNGLTLGTNSWSCIRESIKEIYGAATANEFAFGTRATSTVMRALINLEDDDAAVAAFMSTVGSLDGITPMSDGVISDANGTYWTKGEDDVWTQSTADGTAYRVVDKAYGDYMVTFKINSTSSQANMRFWYNAANFIEVMSPSNNELFFTANGKWASESEVGAPTNVFFNEDIGTAEGSDGWLDVMLVKSGNTFSLYVCEYLDAEGKAATYENWTLMYSYTSEGVETYGEGFSRSWSNGWGNVQNGIKGLLASNEIAIALHCRAGTGQYKYVITDDDAAVAAFMASEKAVAEYAKA